MASDRGDPWQEIHRRGDADLAFAFARLFWPSFVERLGCVLLEHRAVETEISKWLDEVDGDRRRVEAILNHVHLWDEMPSEQSELEDETLMDVARTIQRCWRAALAAQFPGRDFEVEVVGPDDDYGPTVYVVSKPDSSS